MQVPAIFFPGWPGFISFLSLLGPAFAALVVSLLCGDRAGLADLFRGLRRWRVRLVWYLAALFLPMALIGGLVVVSRVFGESAPISGAAAPFAMLFLSNFLYLIFLVWGEELGWRGYALPRLQRRLHPLAASAVLGLLWGVWHLPNFWVAGSPQRLFPIPVYLLYIFGHTFLYSWVYNGTRGSLLLVCIHHAATNAAVVSFLALPGSRSVIEHSAALLIVIALADLLVILLTRGRLGLRS